MNSLITWCIIAVILFGLIIFSDVIKAKFNRVKSSRLNHKQICVDEYIITVGRDTFMVIADKARIIDSDQDDTFQIELQFQHRVVFKNKNVSGFRINPITATNEFTVG